MVMMVFLDGAQYERMMMVLEVGGSESPKEGMLNRSPGTSEGGGHLLIVVIYISSYQSSFNSSIHYFKILCCQNPKQSSTRSKWSIVTAYCMSQSIFHALVFVWVGAFLCFMYDLTLSLSETLISTNMIHLVSSILSSESLKLLLVKPTNVLSTGSGRCT